MQSAPRSSRRRSQLAQLVVCASLVVFIGFGSRSVPARRLRPVCGPTTRAWTFSLLVGQLDEDRLAGRAGCQRLAAGRDPHAGRAAWTVTLAPRSTSCSGGSPAFDWLRRTAAAAALSAACRLERGLANADGPAGARAFVRQPRRVRRRIVDASRCRSRGHRARSTPLSASSCRTSCCDSVALAAGGRRGTKRNSASAAASAGIGRIDLGHIGQPHHRRRQAAARPQPHLAPRRRRRPARRCNAQQSQHRASSLPTNDH